LFPIKECVLLLPARIGNFTDFYASIHHATNVGKMFRPENPLLPNYKYVPIGYHGRASSVVVSGAAVRWPSGQTRIGDAAPIYGPSKEIDYECELGFFAGPGNSLGSPIPIAQAENHLFGFCLLNDWSARDIQRWEYQPLGPFLSKSFATTISPFIVTADALEPFRVPRAPRDVEPVPYLDCEKDWAHGGFSIFLEVWLATSRMPQPMRLSRAAFSQIYWTPAQMIAHHTSNGCNLQPGDLIGSGTVSGPNRDSMGCLLEITRGGRQPIALPSGETRAFLQPGDEVILRGYAEREGFRRIGFGECRGKLAS
jgi:fumarylacetoacetase